MTSPEPEATVFVSLGSNIDPQQNLQRAVRRLAQHGTILAVSSVYQTAPQGFSEQPDFLNLAVKLTTPLSPLTFKHQVLDWIEQQLGRQRDLNNKNAPRTIDLDISLWNEAVLEYGSKPWRVPDPDITRFAHVALPLAEIAPNYRHPTENVSLAEIAARFKVDFQKFPFPLEASAGQALGSNPTETD